MAAPALPGPGSLDAGAPAVQMSPPRANAGRHRGLYITLGAMIVLVALVAAGFSAPRWFKTRANAGRDSQTNGVAPVQPATPAVVETPSAPKAAGTKRAVSQPAGDQTPEIHA